ncbi:MAG: PA14 domain-containing protein [Kiritimatiellae bacterium]|jgi:hypothetical protein|nr:PA14 domain-containing protein [Kiritimatiellia bacterium]
MLFFNISLLLGLAMISVPVIIHLLNRKSAKDVMWGAIQFLLDSINSRRQKILLEEILLLVVRCILVGLLALAMARPFIPSGSSLPWLVVLPIGLLGIASFAASFALLDYPLWRKRLVMAAIGCALLATILVGLQKWMNFNIFGSSGKRDVVLIIDGSTSMSRMNEKGITFFEQAVQEAMDLVEESPRGVAYSIIVGSDVPHVLEAAPIIEHRRLTEKLGMLKQPGGELNLPDCMASASICLSQGNNVAKQVVIFADEQACSWQSSNSSGWKMVQKAFRKLSTYPQVTWMSYSVPINYRNISVVDITPSRNIIGTDRAVDFDVTVENTGNEAITPGVLFFEIDGKKMIDNTLGQLDVGEQATVSFKHRFMDSGTHIANARLATTDELLADNERQYIIPVVDELSVLVVEGRPGDSFVKKSAGFLTLALLPSQEKLDTQDDNNEYLVQPVEVTSLQLAKIVDFSMYNAVVLADVQRMPFDVADALASFVKSGGGLLVLSGEKSDSKFYNEWKYGGDAVLPMKLSTWNKNYEEPLKPALETFRVETLDRLLNRQDNDFSTWLIKGSWDVDQEAGDPNKIEGRYSSGSPMFAVNNLGNGKIIQLTTTLDANAGNIVSRKIYVPLVHELIYTLAMPNQTDLNLTPLTAQSFALSVGVGGFDASGKSHGLKSTFYKGDSENRNSKLTKTTKTVRNIDFDWKDKNPYGGTPDNFTAIFEGRLTPTISGEFEFTIAGDDRAILWLDGREIVNLRNAGSATGKANLVANKDYKLKMKYQEDTGDAFVKMYWQTAGLPKEIVPQANFSMPVTEQKNLPTGIKTFATGPGKEKFQMSINQLGPSLYAQMKTPPIPGLFKLEVPSMFDQNLSWMFEKNTSLIPFVITLNSEESLMAALSEGALADITKYVDIMSTSKLEDVKASVEGKSFGREIWRFLAVGALILVLAEIMLSRWIAVQRRTGKEERVKFEEMSN